MAKGLEENAGEGSFVEREFDGVVVVGGIGSSGEESAIFESGDFLALG